MKSTGNVCVPRYSLVKDAHLDAVEHGKSASSITFSPRMKKTSFATFSGFKTITMGESLAETFSDEKHGKRACSRGQRSEDRGTGKANVIR